MIETRNYDKKLNNYENHTRFGGYVRSSDFDIYPSLKDPNGYHTMTDIAERIISDWKFDEQCKKNAENRDKTKKYKKGIN